MQTTGGQPDPVFSHTLKTIIVSIMPLYGLVKVFSITKDGPPTMAAIKDLLTVEDEVKKKSQAFTDAAAVGPDLRMSTFFARLIQAFALDLALECEKALNQNTLVITRRSNVSS